MARVYVSSTFADLEDHREAVRQAIRRMGHTDVAMEYYVAEDRRPLDKCLADVREADLYLIVMAWRYGYIPPTHTDSITHLEYQAARAAGIPCLAFVLDDNAPWPPNRMERTALDRVDAFRAELTQNHLTGLFTSKDDLARQVTEALQHWERQQTGQPATTTNWDAYSQAVVERYRWVTLSVIAGAQHDRLHHIPLLDVFVPPRVQAGRPHYDVPDRGSSVPEDSTTALGREFRQIFLGGPGSGKSTMFRAEMLRLCDAPKLVETPFLIELREYALRGSTDFVTYLRETTWDKFGVRLTEEALEEVLSGRRVIVFFDGLDEIFEPAVRARVVDQLQSFANRFPRAGIAVSSRIVGYDESGLGLAGFTHYTLLDFGLVEVGKFIPRWYQHYTLENDERDAAGLVRRISENPRLLELAGNPLLLTMMAIIYKNQDLPEKRWQLYARCVDVLLEDWDVKRKKINRDELLPFPMVADQKAEILQNVATTMLSHSGRQELNAVRYELLRNIVADYLHDQYGRSPGEARAIAIDILNHLRERTYLLAETGDQIFGFVHRTFMEYFAARHILAEFNRNKADYDWLKNEVYLKHWKTDRWREPLFLLSGMLAGQGSPVREVVTALMDHSLPFAARCLGEAGTVPPEDRSWARDLVHTLVARLRRTLSMSGRERDEFVEESLAAFGLLAAFVEVSADTWTLTAQMAGSKSPKIRIIGWQLGSAFRTKESRLQYAIESLSDDDQAVRRAAVAALAREWPGDDGVFQAMVTQLLDEEDLQVREAMISAMDSGWPRRTETLDAIEQRMATETEWDHAVWVIGHLASARRGDVRARNIVLGTAALPHPIGAAVLDVPGTLLRGWSEIADTRWFLRHAAATADNRQVRLTAIRTYVDLDPAEALDWLWSFIDEDEAPSLDEIFFELARVQSRPEVLDWFIAVVGRHPSARRRAAAALDSTARSIVDTEIKLRAYAHSHPDENTRAVALSAVRNIVPADSLGMISASFRGFSIPDQVILAARQILSSNQLREEERKKLEAALAGLKLSDS